MNISSLHLATHLRERFAGLYVVHGEELLLVQETMDQIRAAARLAGFGDRRVFEVERGFDWTEVQEASRSMSLFGDRCLIELRLASAKPGTAGAAALEALARAAGDQTAFLIQLPRLDATVRKSTWFTALERSGATIQIDKVAQPQLAGWISLRLKKQGQYIEKSEAGQQALQFMVDCVEGNLLAAHQEIQKLGLLYPSGELTASQLREAVLDVARYDVFQLSETFLAGDIRRLSLMLEGLQQEDVSPVLVLWVLAEDIRVLLRVQKSLAAGQAWAQALRDNRVWGARAQLMGAALKRCSQDALQAGLSLAAQLDRQIKGVGFLRTLPALPAPKHTSSKQAHFVTGKSASYVGVGCLLPFSTYPYAALPLPGIWEGLFQLAAGLGSLPRG